MKILGQDPDVFLAIWSNVVSWLFSLVGLSHLLISKNEAEETSNETKNRTKCISIGRPGGLEQLRLITLKEGIATLGYNIREFSLPPFTPPRNKIPSDCVLIKNHYFSVNYADCAIRWGLYDSAKAFVGWPIVPGFDIAGVVTQVGDDVQEFTLGGKVFGCTLFGAYSDCVLVPKIQLRKLPPSLSLAEAASLPAVSLTALYALSLAGQWPLPTKYSRKSILIHSAAGGVGSMLVQMSKILGLSPIVGVVGSSEKVGAARALGCDVVIDKSTSTDLWEEIEQASPGGYAAIMDANGISTLQQSFDHLAQCGRLIIYGMHSNVPLGKDMLSPFQWISMAWKMSAMPKFDPASFIGNKAVLGFNLSFFAEEREVLGDMFDQVCGWLGKGRLRCPNIVEMGMERVGDAHALIQSGTSVGKIVINTM